MLLPCLWGWVSDNRLLLGVVIIVPVPAAVVIVLLAIARSSHYSCARVVVLRVKSAVYFSRTR
jgi:hypothetical protein